MLHALIKKEETFPHRHDRELICTPWNSQWSQLPTEESLFPNWQSENAVWIRLCCQGYQCQGASGTRLPVHSER